MKPDVSPRQHQVLSHLSVLPRKILALHGKEHVSEYILHELCNGNCFNMIKAAYFVDNPDFDCLRGIAGYSQEEHKAFGQEFYDHLNACHFNKEVQSIACSSYKRAKKSERDLLSDLAPSLSMKNPSCYSWPLKHDNQGILIYEIVSQDTEDLRDSIQNGLHLLGFCPFN